MKAVLEVVDGGLGNAIQDGGRFGYRHMGITASGCLDRMLARCANALVGNRAPDVDFACIEVRGAGPALAVRQGRVRVACVAMGGALEATVRRASGRSFLLPAWSSVLLDANDVLETGALAGGVAYIAVSGGVLTPPQLGSRSTYQRAGIGGIDGRFLMSGDELPCLRVAAQERREYQAVPWAHASGPIRVMLGPQDGHFKTEALRDLLNTEYRVTPQLDRMGMRLDGAALAHVSPQAADIVSDGVTPGVVQVPGNGQPIVLLADCQTVGGYPKIATVISADLPRLAQMQPGETVRFAAVDRRQAVAALADGEACWQSWAQAVQFGLPNAARLADDVDVVWNAGETPA